MEILAKLDQIYYKKTTSITNDLWQHVTLYEL